MQEFLTKIVLSVFSVCIFSFCAFLVFYFSFQEYKDWEIQKSLPATPFVDDGVCNVAIIPISGVIGVGLTSAQTDASGETITTIPVTGDVDRVIHDLEFTKNSGVIRGVILQIDSYGSYGNAAQLLLNYLKNYPLPVVALIRDAGTSGAYWISLGTKKIIAYRGADVGSIGVNSSFVSSVEKNKKDGLKYVSIVSGKYKDIGIPEKELSEEDLAFLKKENENFFNLFVEDVASKRNISVEEVKKIADGRSFLSSDAKKLGLIDEVGDEDTALKFMQDLWKASSSLDVITGEASSDVAIPCPKY